LARIGTVVVAAVMILAGPVMIGVGSQMADDDAVIAQTGTRTAGTIIDFQDTRRASQRDITVAYTSTDGTDRRTFASVDHDQHPVVGEDVTVVYREQQPDEAVVLGYESDGISVRGIGTILTLIFTTTGLILIIRRRRRIKRTP
jgi:hypothetical protein